MHSDINASRRVYLGGEPVPAARRQRVGSGAVRQHAAAAQSLGSPSSAARALYAGAPYIERVDRLVQAIAAQKGLRLPILDEVVGLVDAKLREPQESRLGLGPRIVMVLDSELLDFSRNRISSHS